MAFKNRIRVRIINPRERETLEKQDHLTDELVEKFKGFSRVVHLLVQSKKPIVGHNCLLDMMKIYHQFYKPLPMVHPIQQ